MRSWTPEHTWDKHDMSFMELCWRQSLTLSISTESTTHGSDVERSRVWRRFWFSLQDHSHRRFKRGQDVCGAELQNRTLLRETAEHHRGGLHRPDPPHPRQESQGPLSLHLFSYCTFTIFHTWMRSSCSCMRLERFHLNVKRNQFNQRHFWRTRPAGLSTCTRLHQRCRKSPPLNTIILS